MTIFTFALWIGTKRVDYNKWMDFDARWRFTLLKLTVKIIEMNKKRTYLFCVVNFFPPKLIFYFGKGKCFLPNFFLKNYLGKNHFAMKKKVGFLTERKCFFCSEKIIFFSGLKSKFSGKSLINFFPKVFYVCFTK